LRFEASVGGGIPVLSPLAADLAANRVECIRGIVNGTTNYILSAMAAGEGTYDSVLSDAQQRGYAEADPRGDVEGRDAVNKLVVLSRLAFGEWLAPECVTNRPPTAAGSGAPGITGVTVTELEAAAAIGLTIRLLATALRDDAGAVQARVVPTAVPGDSALGRTTGVRNRIEVQAQPVGLVGFDGLGAGGEATSSAVLGDLAAIASGRGSTWADLPPAGAAASAPPAGASPSAPAASSAVPKLTGNDDTTSGRWFALLPGVRAADIAALKMFNATRETASGAAVRTNPTTLQALRSTVLDALPQAKSVPWYPIDE
jgi:homoserine dehydrogenase